MFYIKKQFTDGTKINVEIEDENIFTKCPECGKEVQMTFEELSSIDFDLFGTQVFCEECTANRRKKNE